MSFALVGIACKIRLFKTIVRTRPGGVGEVVRRIRIRNFGPRIANNVESNPEFQPSPGTVDPVDIAKE